MQPRQRIIIYIHVMIWLCASLFILVETNISDLLPCAGIVTCIIFGGALWAMYPRKQDASRLFCKYHIAMALLCLLIGIGDVVNFYTEIINYKIYDAIFAVLKILLIISAVQTTIKWVVKTIKSIKNAH